MLFPERLYQVDDETLRRLPPTLFWRQFSFSTTGGQEVQLAAWPRDRMFIVQTLNVRFSATAGAGGSDLARLRLRTTDNVALIDWEGFILGSREPLRPDRANRLASASASSNCIASFNLTNEVRGVWLPFGSDLRLDFNWTGVGTAVVTEVGYSGFIVPRGSLIV